LVDAVVTVNWAVAFALTVCSSGMIPGLVKTITNAPAGFQMATTPR